MSTTSTGRLAEEEAANYLSKNYSLNLIAKNWRTRTCEIDLIMQKGCTIHFIEVKFRRSNYTGGGLASISPSKLNRMLNASMEWFDQNPNYQDYAPNIAAIEIIGGRLKDENINFIESIDYDL
jgi:uncharacterized protein (TIGR00252 family)